MSVLDMNVDLRPFKGRWQSNQFITIEKEKNPTIFICLLKDAYHIPHLLNLMKN